jgi:hypothetical protein
MATGAKSRGNRAHSKWPAALHLKPMHKVNPYRCSICGAEVPNLPMAVYGHQLSHVGRRPWARDRAESFEVARTSDETERHDADGT